MTRCRDRRKESPEARSASRLPGRVFASVVVLLSGVSIASAQESDWDRHPGCYTVEIGAWKPDYDPELQILSIPAVIRLTSDPNAGPHGGRHSRAVKVLETREGSWPVADSDLREMWTVQGDTIVVHLSGSLGGYQLVLEASAENGEPRLAGTIFAWDEYERPNGEPEPRAPVRLRPVDCLARPGHR